MVLLGLPRPRQVWALLLMNDSDVHGYGTRSRCCAPFPTNYVYDTRRLVELSGRQMNGPGFLPLEP
jgi:hypothetical protein